MRELLKSIRESNMLVEVIDGKLKVFAGDQQANAELIAEIRNRKNELLQFLLANDQSKFKDSYTATIPVIPPAPGYCLSSSQRRLWILNQLEQNTSAYNKGSVHTFEGAFNSDALQYAFECLIKRHEILRTVFDENESGEPMQFIKAVEEYEFVIACVDLRDNENKDEELESCLGAAFETPFNLSTGPLLRAGLYQVAENKWIFSFVMHHIISDGWSMDILIRELLFFYNAYMDGNMNMLPPLRIQYKDYAAWQQARLGNEALKGDRDYWVTQFAGELPVLELRGDYNRPAIKTYNGGKVSRMMGKEVSSGIKQLSQQQGATLFMGLLSAVNALLYRYTGQQDIVIGSPVAGRDHTDLEGQIGFYVNTLALRTKFNGSESFSNLLESVKEVTLGAYEHQVYPFDELVSALDTGNDISRSVLFDVMVVLQNAGNGSSSTNGNVMKAVNINGYQSKSSETINSKFDLTFDFNESEYGIQLGVEYNSDIYSRETAERMANHFELLLEHIVSHPGMAVNQLEYLAESEKQQLTETFNDTSSVFPADKTIIELFEHQVSKTPDAAALLFEETSLTYREVDEKANQLAHYLREQHAVVPGDLVGVLVDRNEWMVIILLGILKSGGAYVPMDTAYPRERIEYMLADSNAKVLISAEWMAQFAAEQSAYSTASPLRVNSMNDLAYIIYTSGSTGHPKGVMIEHINAAAFINWSRKEFESSDFDTVISATSICFDLSVFEIFYTLSAGKQLRIVENALSIPMYLNTSKKILLNTVPGVVGSLTETGVDLSSVTVLNMAGEPIPPKNLRGINFASTEVRNLYGPSEDTTYSTVYRITGTDRICIGHPVDNTRIYILNEALQLQPAGVAGELCISGTCVARGYFNREELTAEKFINNPYEPGVKMYRTGDLARWLPDGNIDFLGRKDDQVKVRGYRIELGEIQSVMEQHPLVTSAILVSRSTRDEHRELIAYVVCNAEISPSDLRAYLSTRLPGYMVPGYFVMLDQLPLTPNGKVDKRALPAPEEFAANTGIKYLAPRNITEEKLAAIWAEVLGREKVGVKDNFFQMGGHSLKATRLSSQVYKVFEVKLPLKVFFTHAVLEEQAEIINKAKKSVFHSIPAASPQDSYLLSPSQRRLWILSQFEEGNIAYNVPGVFVFEGDLDIDALRHALNALIERHEALRTVFRKDEAGEIRQFINMPSESGFQLTCRDLRNENNQAAKAEQLLQEEFAAPFSLDKGPLLRATLYQVEDSKWVFSYVLHHIISDGWSMGVIIRELLVFYNSYTRGELNPLPPLRIQYKDYAEWQHAQMSGDKLEAHKNFWLKHFEGELPVLELPGDWNRPPVKTYNGERISWTINAEQGRGIKTLCQQHGATLFMGLLGAVNALLYRYTGQQDIIIGTPLAGREHIDLEDQIGFYVNTLALRTQFSGNDSYSKLLENIKQVTLGAYEHQAFSFGDLADALQLQRDMSRNPLFDVEVIVQNAGTAVEKEKETLGNVKVGLYDGGENTTSRFDMVFNFVETGDELSASLVYNSDIYNKTTAWQLAAHLQQLIGTIIETPELPLNRLDFLSAGDKEKLLASFNNTGTNSPQGKTLVDLFEEQALRLPGNTAVVFGDVSLTFRELDEKSNKLANYLRSGYELKPGEAVGVMLDRSEKLLIALLGILKAGGVYVPIDPEYPSERKKYILDDTALEVLITQTDYMFDLEYYQHNVFAIDIQMDTLTETAEPCGAVIKPGDLAYIIYTSGSTGMPKGVMIEHAAAANSILAQQAVIDLKPGDRSLQFLSISFDVSVFEMFIALISGAALYIIKEEDKKNPLLLEKFITGNQIDMASIPPAYLKLLQVEKIKTLKKLLTGGEAADTAKINSFLEYGTYFNAYGPTESGISATVFRMEQGGKITGKNIPVGAPLANIRVYILDEWGNLMPAGTAGEICIGGAGLARGYLNNPALSAEKFTDDPFRKGEKMYKTGDWGRWLADGNIEFLGRKDDQVKIRGYRIEPGEIESALQAHEDIDSAVVAVKSNQAGVKELVAYIQGKKEQSTAGIRAYLSKILPAHMIPGHFVQLDEMPLTANGKVDKSKLPPPEGLDMSTGVDYVAPQSATEKKMAEIWGIILGKEKVGITNSFFDLGGDSIKILQMMAELRKELDLDIPIGDIYKHNTIEGILAHVSDNKTEIDQKNFAVKEREAIVRSEIEALKERIINSPDFLNRENAEDIYPMSDIEKGMLYESLVNEKMSIYHDQMVRSKKFSGFDIERFRTALWMMVQKHQILRTSFNISDYGTEVQIVHKEIEYNVYYHDLSGLKREDQEAEVRSFLKAERKKPFKFSEAPLWRMSVYNFGADEIVFVFQTHHAIIDGWSDSVFTTEINNLYLKLESNPGFMPGKLKASYKDCIIQLETDKKNEEIKEFWKNELSDYSRLDLFTDEDDADRHPAWIDADSFGRLQKTAADLNTSVKVMSLSAYLYLLKVINYNSEILAGLVTNTRPNTEDSEKILGCFLNTVPLRMTIDGSKTCREFVSEVNNKLTGLKDYERLSILEISQLIGKQYGTGNPFFDVIFNFADFHAYNALEETAPANKQETALPPVNVSGYGRTNTYFDLSVNITGARYAVTVRLNKKLKCGFSAEKITELYLCILHHLINMPDDTVNSIKLLDDAEKEQLLVTLNNTPVTYSNDKTIAALFQEQVRRTPGNTALVFQGAEMTYRELNHKSNQIAGYLRAKYTIAADDLVGVKLERGTWMIAAILGILKAGAAYVPVDPDYPQERIDYILSDSGCKLLIDSAMLDDFIKEEALYSKRNLKPVSGMRNLAYVIYTSGSTGEPKGVMIEHAAAANAILAHQSVLQIKEGEKCLQLLSTSFDASVYEIFGALLAGGQLFIIEEKDKKNPVLLEDFIAENGIETASIPPAYLKMLEIEKIHTLKKLLTGGEAVSPGTANTFSENGVYYNAYGPTEASISATVFELPKNQRITGNHIPIGKPLPNVSVYIADDSLKLVPPGVVGEIFIGGAGLSRGYLNNPALSRDKFTDNPFKKGELVYKTGDLGRWRPDGNLEFAGRKDFQLKIRGYRVETGEIEAALLAHHYIESVAVVARNNKDGDKELAAYVVSQQELDAKSLRSFLAGKLPVYMLPDYYVQLEQLPLTANGKLDRSSLPDPAMAGMQSGAEYVPPGNEIEKKLVNIWQELLGKEKIGIRDNFFELGGHSIKVMKLMALIQKEFDIKIKIESMFNKTTIEDISADISRAVWVKKGLEESSAELIESDSFII